jgi:Domain of unknown function (DUF397)
MEDQIELSWHKSSYSGNGGGSCVEVGTGLPDKVAIRDTKNLAGPVLTVSDHVWTEFVEAIKLGELDL